MFRFAGDPEDLSITVVNGSSGLLYNQVQDRWALDAGPVLELASGLDTTVGFLEREGRLYLVRNLMDAGYRPIGTLALALDPAYFFGDLSLLPWASAVSVRLGEDALLTLKGDAPPQPGGRTLEHSIQGRYCTLRGMAVPDYTVLITGAESFRWLLPTMGLSLFLLLLLTFRFFRRKISRPIQVLMEGAAQIRQGELGYQLDAGTGSREFQYLTDSFNQMSSQLRRQFDRLYQEELARRDAQIKALQAHINPHFLNNTLEIINWEARLADNQRVCSMIEALSTMLDAAISRDGRSTVTLAEELKYVDAYLYITQERLGDRLTVTRDVDPEVMGWRVLLMMLQPIVENAVEHDLSRSGGELCLRAYPRRGAGGARLCVEVEHDGAIPARDWENIRRSLEPQSGGQKPGGSVGIRNVNQRLRLLYGEDYRFDMAELRPGRILTRLEIPGEEGGK